MLLGQFIGEKFLGTVFVTNRDKRSHIGNIAGIFFNPRSSATHSSIFRILALTIGGFAAKAFLPDLPKVCLLEGAAKRNRIEVLARATRPKARKIITIADVQQFAVTEYFMPQDNRGLIQNYDIDPVGPEGLGGSTDIFGPGSCAAAL